MMLSMKVFAVSRKDFHFGFFVEDIDWRCCCCGDGNAGAGDRDD